MCSHRIIAEVYFMLRLILTFILCIFAGIGIAHIFNCYICSIFKSDDTRLKQPGIIFTVRNCQDTIEPYIRSFIWRFFSDEHRENISKITIVDLCSDDETLSILKRLESEYEFLNVYDKYSYIHKIECEL